MNISTIVCTYNRAEYLRKAIQSLVDQTLAKEEYEILVIDNGSNDNTKRVVEEFAFVPNLRYLYEPTLGVSQARNTGWRNACGEYVACLDDDAIASPEWLEKILKVFGTVKPQPGCVGGKIEPIWEAPWPLWLSGEIATFLTIQDWSESPIILNTLDGTQWLAAANLAFQKCLLEMLGGFPTDLDRKGYKLLSGGETLLLRQLERMGYSCFYHPEIVVSHHVHASRLNQGWFIRRAYWEGITEAIIGFHMESRSNGKWLRIATSETLRLLRTPREMINLLIPTNDPTRFARKSPTFEKIGHIVGLLQGIFTGVASH